MTWRGPICSAASRVRTPWASPTQWIAAVAGSGSHRRLAHAATIIARALGSRRWRSAVRVEGGVEAAPGSGAGAGLDRAVDAVAPEHHVAHTREVASTYDVAVRQRHLGPRGDVTPRLDDAVVAERDTDAGVRSEQAALAQ